MGQSVSQSVRHNQQIESERSPTILNHAINQSRHIICAIVLCLQGTIGSQFNAAWQQLHPDYVLPDTCQPCGADFGFGTGSSAG